MSSGAQRASARPRVIFIRGITQRSGTNYLRDLVTLHPQCCHARQPIWEDFSLDDAAHLDRYVARLSRRWPPAWGVPEAEIRAQLLREFGDALVRSLVANPKRPGVITVAKTPSVRGLRHYFDMFPDDPLLVLVRDGRSVVESSMRSFGQSFERAAHDWVSGADTVVRFREQHGSTEGTRWLLLRYEDVVRDVRTTIRRIVDFMGLDPDAIDISKASSLPVRGSSSFRTQDGNVNWTRVPKDESFKPLERSAAWDDERHRRFNRIAGEQMTELGYQLAGPPVRFTDRIRYQPRDIAYLMSVAARRARRSWADD